MELTQARLKQVLAYNRRTGHFLWRPAAMTPHTNRGITRPWARAGTPDQGYIKIGVDGKVYRANRLAVFYMTGKWPEQLVDHKNGDTLDNSWLNLRPATHKQNQQNRALPSKNSKSGYLGVSWFPHKNRWVARIVVDKKIYYLGYYKDVEKAAAAYVEAKARMHPFSARLVA